MKKKGTENEKGDDDCIKDGLPHMPESARKKIDAILAKAKGEE